MNLFTSKELLIMGVILITLVITLIILIILEIKDKRKQPITIKIEEKKLATLNTTNDNTNNPKENNIIKEETINNQEVEIETLDLNTDINVVKIEPVNQEIDKQALAQAEIKKTMEELSKEFDLENTITNLETIEEENAIISYQELLENTNQLDTVLTDDGDEPITINEVLALFTQDDKGELLEPISNPYNSEFEATPLVSPINGLEFENLTEIQLENTANLEKLDKEIRKTNEFLNILNELKKNLE